METHEIKFEDFQQWLEEKDFAKLFERKRNLLGRDTIDMFVKMSFELAKEYHNQHNTYTPSFVNDWLLLVVEFGYQQCEKGNNLEMAKREFNKLKITQNETINI